MKIWKYAKCGKRAHKKKLNSKNKKNSGTVKDQLKLPWSKRKKTITFKTETFLHLIWNVIWNIPVGIYLLKVNNKNTRTMCEICSKSTIKAGTRTKKKILKIPFYFCLIEKHAIPTTTKNNLRSFWLSTDVNRWNKIYPNIHSSSSYNVFSNVLLICYF